MFVCMSFGDYKPAYFYNLHFVKIMIIYIINHNNNNNLIKNVPRLYILRARPSESLVVAGIIYYSM